jgi:hypothetical protein
MSFDEFVIMPEPVRQHVAEVFQRGQEMGRDANALSILGDSLIATQESLAKWDSDSYVLGEYDYLQPTIDHYAGSFGRETPSVRIGLHSWSVFDPLWADKDLCEPNEDVLTCEIRRSNPSVLFIFLGSNDAGSPGGFSVNVRMVVEKALEQGIVPIMATKADRFEGPDNVNNTLIRQLAADLQVPLLEFDLLANTLPDRGLSNDAIHLTFVPADYSLPETLQYGYPTHNLASLMILDAVHKLRGP